MDDAALLRAMQRGDDGAVTALYDRYGGAAYGLAYRVTNDATLAEDVVQDAFVSVWKQCSRFDASRGKVKSWLMTIVHHRAVDSVRRLAGRPERAIPDGWDAPSPDGTPGAQAEAEFDAAAVREAVAQVPEEQRTTILMAYFEGLTHVEIARRMGVPPGTVKSRLRLGLEKMRAYLQPVVLE